MIKRILTAAAAAGVLFAATALTAGPADAQTVAASPMFGSIAMQNPVEEILKEIINDVLSEL